MKYAEIKKLDCANGKGIGSTIFFSGCTHNCDGCFNKAAQDFNYGNEFTKEIENEFIEYAKHPAVTHISILGGEPMQQNPIQMLEFVKRIKKEVKKPVWLWTGYIIEDLFKNKNKFEILQYVDILVDGRFEIQKRNIRLKYRGSENQRVIDVKRTLAENKIILFEN